MEIKLNGWGAVIAIIAMIVFVVFRYNTASHELQTQGVEALKTWVAAEYSRYHLARKDASLQEKADALISAADIEILSINERGPLDSPIVRVELAPNKAHPPGTPYVRYYHMEYSTLAGWRHKGDASVWRYRLALF
ncbi:MAG: hypothetical protein KZQ58_12360 [gamma proteobacterium symbiont of Bathyaustriella thionipta]|nr:hypothetical protein [gamma proteobacterium symbiont of Bathyaustriella thionipta]